MVHLIVGTFLTLHYCCDRGAPKPLAKNPVYYVLGQTRSGRYLFCVVIQFPNRKGFPVTARAMREKEKRQFKRWKRQ